MSSRAKRKRERRLFQMCRGCAFRVGTDAYEARMGRPRVGIDEGFKAEVDRCLGARGAIPFYCHEPMAENPDGHRIPLREPEANKLCAGWLEVLSAGERQRRRDEVRP